MAVNEWNEVTDRVGGPAAPTTEWLRPEMTFLAENPEAFGLVPDACPLATKHLLIAANGHSAEGGGGSLVYDLERPGVEGLLDFYVDLLPDTEESELALRHAFGESTALREHPVSRYCAALAEISALRTMNGLASEASFEKAKVLLNEELRRDLYSLRERFVELERVDVVNDAVFEPSLCVCRIREEGSGHFVADIFSAGDFRVYLIDEQGMAPLWSEATPVFSPEREVGLQGRSLRFYHPAPFAVLLVSESICTLNAAEYRGLRSDPGLIWRYRMRLEDYFLRLITDCVREYEFGDRATRFFVGRSHGRDSASGALVIMRNGVSYETFRLHCQNRLSGLGRQMELLPNGYDPQNIPAQEPRDRTEIHHLRALLENSPELTDSVTNALCTTILRKFQRGQRGEAESEIPVPEGVPAYRRLDMNEIRKVYHRLDCENHSDRTRIAENHAILRESLSEHWITLRPLLMPAADAPNAEIRDYRDAGDELYRVCVDMNRRLAECMESRRALMLDIQKLMADSLNVANAEGKDWLCGRAGADSVMAWLDPLQNQLPDLLNRVAAGWQADTERYRSLLSAYTFERDDLFRRDVTPVKGGFAVEWQGILDGSLSDRIWDGWYDDVTENPATAGFGDFLNALRRVSRGTGALLTRIRGRAAESRMARELSSRMDMRIAALRGAAYEDLDWGEEVIAVVDTATRNEFRATVRRWQETRLLMEQQKQAYEEYSSMYAKYVQ